MEEYKPVRQRRESQNAFSENALRVLQSRYLLRNMAGELVETPDQLFKRVAKAVAQAELSYGGAAKASEMESHFEELMKDLLFLPNSPTLMNAGTQCGQLSACFVLPVADSLDAIFTTLKLTALIQQSGGGTGFNFSKLRPKGDRINGCGGLASGPVSFMKLFDYATSQIKAGGKRRGANMGILNVDHPDIEEFICAKADEKSLSNFNISVGIHDSFMQALEQDLSWTLRHPGTGQPVKTVKATFLWDLIVEHAWKCGDPGLIFLDTINRKNPIPAAGLINCTNPCGEVPLLPYEPCNLGSLNLARMLKGTGSSYGIDWQKLKECVHFGIRFLDNVIDVNYYTAPEIARMARANRKLGLGVMGWAEMLIQLGIPYASTEAVKLAGTLMEFIQTEARQASMALAKGRGKFENWEKSIFYPHTPIRNATRTSIAPTGTLSILANTSSSIEPLFALAYQRRDVLEHETLITVNPLLQEKLSGIFPQGIPPAILAEGDLSRAKEVPLSLRRLFKTALEIPYTYHIRHQLAFQQHTDNAVAKTINMPQKASKEDVYKAYKMAWRLGAKGITVYRSGSKTQQVLYKGTNTQADSSKLCAG